MLKSTTHHAPVTSDSSSRHLYFRSSDTKSALFSQNLAFPPTRYRKPTSTCTTTFYILPSTFYLLSAPSSPIPFSSTDKASRLASWLLRHCKRSSRVPENSNRLLVLALGQLLSPMRSSKTTSLASQRSSKSATNLPACSRRSTASTRSLSSQAPNCKPRQLPPSPRLLSSQSPSQLRRLPSCLDSRTSTSQHSSAHSGTKQTCLHAWPLSKTP